MIKKLSISKTASHVLKSMYSESMIGKEKIFFSRTSFVYFDLQSPFDGTNNPKRKEPKTSHNDRERIISTSSEDHPQ